MALLGLLPAACGDSAPEVGQLGAVEGFVGVVAVEESRAALLAKDVLSTGGTAADAATAAFFAMSVTYPVGVGLGGGGICAVYDPLSDKAEILDFLPRAPAAGGEIALPTAVRGIASLHARYGRLRWSQVVTPAERLARFGHPISRALLRRLAPVQGLLDGDLMLKAHFLTNLGELRREGSDLVQVELATVLGRIRSKGVADFHGGESGKLFIEDSTKLGGKVTIDELRRYIPAWHAGKTWEFGNLIVHGPPAGVGGGDLLARLIDGFAADEDDLSIARRLAVTSGAYGAGGTARPLGDAAIAIVDWQGSAVACHFTLGRELGMARIMPSLGFAPVPTAAADAYRYVAPVVANNPFLTEGYFAAAAGGGALAPAALAPAVVDILEADRGLETAVRAPRAVQLGTGGEALQESGDNRSIGRVQAVYCPKQPTRNQKTCGAISDPRGFGLGLGQIN